MPSDARPLAAVIALSLSSVPAPARAAQATACHCFTARTFDAAHPLAADPYILAAARSSLLSAATGVAKAELVRAVMAGTLPEDLWIAHWGAPVAGATPGFLLAARAETGSWRVALATARALPPAFREALARGAASVELAGLAVDDVLVRRLGAESAALRAVRGAGATSEETIVAAFLAPRLGAPPAEVLGRVRSGGASWGSLLASVGLGPERLDQAIRAAMR